VSFTQGVKETFPFFFLVVLKMKSVVGVGSNDKRPNHFG
jgi:hypothetical protein